LEFNSLIINTLKTKEKLSKKELVELIHVEIPDMGDSTISWRLHQMKSQGLIQSLSYGNYSLQHKNHFTPNVSSSLKRLYNRVHKEFPFLQICAWDSRWFNDLMIHQLFRFYLVIEVEKEATESVFNSLSAFSKNVFLKPSDDIFQHYISNFNEVIIVKPLISESPLIENAGIKITSIEKLLIDCLADKELFAAQQNELDYIYKSAFDKYDVSLSKMKRYAARRNQVDKLKHLLNKDQTNHYDIF
jgi:hypothetical protein